MADGDDADGGAFGPQGRSPDPVDLERRLLRLPPTLCLMSGLPATGKSWYARRIGLALGALVTSSDQRRLDLFGPHARGGRLDSGGSEPSRGADATQDHSTPADRAVYNSLLEDARRGLGSGRSVVVEGSFLKRARRKPFATLAGELSVPFVFVTTTAAEATVRRRLQLRALDPTETSGVDWEAYQRLAAGMEPPTEFAPAQRLEIDAQATLEQSLALLIDRVSEQL